MGVLHINSDFEVILNPTAFRDFASIVSMAWFCSPSPKCNKTALQMVGGLCHSIDKHIIQLCAALVDKWKALMYEWPDNSLHTCWHSPSAFFICSWSQNNYICQENGQELQRMSVSWRATSIWTGLGDTFCLISMPAKCQARASLIFYLFVNNYKYFAQMVFTCLLTAQSITIVSNLKTIVTNMNNFKIAISMYYSEPSSIKY